MSDFVDGGAPAPADSGSVPVATEHSPQSSSLGSQTPVAPKPPAPPPEAAKPEPKAEAKPEPKEASKSPGEAIRRALADVKAKEAAAKEAPKAEAKQAEPEKPGQPRSERGQFASTAQPEQAAQPTQQPSKAPDAPNSPHREPPARFSPDAKAAWETAPEPIRAETHRAIRELEQGHQKYKADAEAFESIREFDQLAKQHGTDIKTALTRYTNMERLLAADPIRGLQELATNMRLPLRDLAAAIVGQPPEQVQSQQDQTIRQLQSQIQQLTQQVSSVPQMLETRERQSQTISQVEQFAKDNPRFEELAEDIELLLSNGRAKDLSEAYEKAARLNPAPAAAPKPEPVIPVDTPPKPLNPAGQKSITGAPSAGSDPATTRQPATSNREALKRALARAG